MNSAVFLTHSSPDVKTYAAGNSTDYLKFGQPNFILLHVWWQICNKLR